MNTNKAVLEIGQYLRTQQQKHFIDIWLKLFDHNFDVRVKAFNTAMKNMFQKIPTIKSKPHSQGQKFQKLVT